MRGVCACVWLSARLFVCLLQFGPMIFWQKDKSNAEIYNMAVHLRACLFITHNMHFPNFSYSKFRLYTRMAHEMPNKENSREYIQYIGITSRSNSSNSSSISYAGAIELFAHGFCCVVCCERLKCSQYHTNRERDKENASNLSAGCLFVRFALLFALHWKYIFT